ncbi:hypothetical protein [Caldalkalibacillus salinus]|uniref:hypothetical protein n=1 Tax=Caldalkalibacillus salinus TaxID=2803787 RepID=UPI0019225A04|nr:hypothetical protein [Caldalkalibacillus salinus]
MKSFFYIGLAMALIMTCILLTGPFNLYYYFNAEEIVKEKSIFFMSEEDMFESTFVEKVENITNVEYIGDKTFIITTRNENGETREFVWRILSSGEQVIYKHVITM